MALDRGAQVGMVAPVREGAHSQGYIDWVKQNVTSSRKIVFQQSAGFVPNSPDEEVLIWSYTLPVGLVMVEESLIITACGFFTGATGSKQVIIRMGGDDGDVLFDTGAAAADTMWNFELNVIRNTSASCKIYTTGAFGGTAIPPVRTVVQLDPELPQSIGIYVGAGELGEPVVDLIRVELFQMYNPSLGY